ncbi:Hypothetical protein NTJ_02307 [Nesidiocoris tenuis]|uniref:Uncharacterized protein n=1 Tax=Nesidiocoris tenuis TaxID=355587 RepID=A0ABN7AB13_9HEMI|nr:Hypothetical protein NTJ_02307 [Nesidiocoris tenuis]
MTPPRKFQTCGPGTSLFYVAWPFECVHPGNPQSELREKAERESGMAPLAFWKREIDGNLMKRNPWQQC